MNNQLTNAINLLHDSKLSANLTNEQIGAITILEGAYLDLGIELTKQADQLHRRNMQIKELKAEVHKKQMEINQLYRDIEKAKHYR